MGVLVVMLLRFAIIAGAIYAAVWLLHRYGVLNIFGGETPIDILNKRYARGEITREEYEQMKQDIFRADEFKL